MAHDVFISYSHKDKSVADAICSRLEGDGVRCWYAPRDIAPGSDWAGSIIDAIASAKIMVLIFTDFSNASSQVLREVGNAVSNSLTIIPFKLTETLPSGSMQYYLGVVHWLDAMNDPLEKSIGDLSTLVQATLSGSAPLASEKEFKEAAPKGSENAATSGAASAPGATPAYGKQGASGGQAAQKKAPIVPIAIAIGLLVVAAIVGFVVLGGQNASSSGSQSATATSATSSGGVTDAVATYQEGGRVTIDDPTNSGTEGNLQCNYLNGGIAASDGTWIYYQSNDAQSIYKMRLDGSEKTKLNDQPSSQIGLIDGVIYYRTASGIYSMDTNGGNSTNVFMGTTEDMKIADGRIYFKSAEDKLRLYSMAMDGTDVKRENELEETYHLNLWDGRIYWSNNEDARKLYSANLDGSDMKILTTSSAEKLCVTDGWILYYDMNKYEERAINLETNECFTVFPGGFTDPTISEHGVISKMNNDLHLYRAQLGSSGMNLLVDESVDNVCIVGDYVFYRGEDHQNHMINVDGTGDTVL